MMENILKGRNIAEEYVKESVTEKQEDTEK